MSKQPQSNSAFDMQYRTLSKDVFHTIVHEQVSNGSDASQQAHAYAERGKPDFALAFLLESVLPDEQKREVLARAYERRATLTEERAREFDHQFHRPFPLLFSEANRDRANAKRVRAGQALRRDDSRSLPTL